jgi:hypothetical protein
MTPLYARVLIFILVLVTHVHTTTTRSMPGVVRALCPVMASVTPDIRRLIPGVNLGTSAAVDVAGVARGATENAVVMV